MSELPISIMTHFGGVSATFQTYDEVQVSEPPPTSQRNGIASIYPPPLGHNASADYQGFAEVKAK